MTSLASYATPCVRACALRSLLLRPEEWGAVGAMESAAEIIEWFKAREVLPEDVKEIAQAEHVAHQAVIHASTALVRLSQGNLRDLLCCFLDYYDLINLESVIHRVHAMVNPGLGVPYDTGRLGVFDDVLGDASNFAALSRMVKGSRFASAYENALVRYYEDENVSRMIESIEVSFFSEWANVAEKCGFVLKRGTDGSGLSVFLAERVVESAVRLKHNRDADTSQVVEWLRLVSYESDLDACIDALSLKHDGEAVMALAHRLLPKSLLGGIETTGVASADALSALRAVVLRRALRTGRGIAFNADFLSSFLVLQIYQALELTLLLEAKDSGIVEVRSAYREIAA